MEGLNVIKLGGSLLTDKSVPYKSRKEKFRDIGRELRENFEKMIIVHGVGSYGHPPVKKYGLYKGYTGRENLINLAKTQMDVMKLRIDLIKALQMERINAMLFLPSSQIIAYNGRIKEFFVEPIKRFLSMGMVPVIGGDIVADDNMGFSVCSGDILAAYLADALEADRLIFSTDTDGIYTADPKKYSDAVLIRELKIDNIDEIARITGSAFTDVTSGMAGKIESVRKYRGMIERGTEVVILSMLNYGNLTTYLRGDKNARYTKIK